MMEGTSQPANTSFEIMPANGNELIAGQNLKYGSSTPSYLTGWSYFNENGKMCGPYVPEQLFEGLANGFLPDDLPIYPIVNGNPADGLQLKYLSYYMNQMYWGNNMPTPPPLGNGNVSVSCSRGSVSQSHSIGQITECTFTATSVVHAVQQSQSETHANYHAYTSEVERFNWNTPSQV